MIPSNGWQLVAALVAFICAIIGIAELYDSRDLWDDWHWAAWLIAGLLWLLVAYRISKDER